MFQTWNVVDVRAGEDEWRRWPGIFTRLNLGGGYSESTRLRGCCYLDEASGFGSQGISWQNSKEWFQYQQGVDIVCHDTAYGTLARSVDLGWASN